MRENIMSGDVGEGRGGCGGVGGPVFVVLSGQGRTGQQVSRTTPQEPHRVSTPPPIRRRPALIGQVMLQ